MRQQLHRPAATGLIAVALAVVTAGCTGSGRAVSARPPVAPPPTPGTTTPTSTTAPPAGVISSQPVLDTLSAGIPATLGPWTLVGRTDVLGASSDQGIATVSRPGGGTEIVYAGTLALTESLRAEGWNHVGDPDSWNGWLVTPFQGGPGAQAKMFEVTAPGGAVTQAVHPLVPGEVANNSFAAVTPDGQWTVSAEWGVEHRLLVFPTPVVNRSYSSGDPLPLVATIQLKEPVTDLQGCAFSNATSLICSGTSDLLELDLTRPVQPGYPLWATVRTVGRLPEVGGCTGQYEPEGVDVDRALGQLRVEVSQPGICNLFTQVYEYRYGAI